mmetsp:Transcript_8538/g.17301  ORF Transcript_8538/g.17301 Transcript_8538/m.17301 type:complete len:95 (+) Transcript_8538:2366-2650(+)
MNYTRFHAVSCEDLNDLPSLKFLSSCNFLQLSLVGAYRSSRAIATGPMRMKLCRDSFVLVHQPARTNLVGSRKAFKYKKPRPSPIREVNCGWFS